eukprot:CAMPEP_0201484618 /NCGR_PEP_ID=MMETSP0151_2-20130828/8782_1 /ASSEMBLY_ACC=CAM_ASM_000257 /TAXON_ID=200890 /ORGANISM="Paramoeba atlantica, Strain 621/1 / CCAP 1560/9" /LENGTH=280 /DNA_ID=CAMNT_0047868361 /DNA_START=46 /DNA_END=885 /DNA_ORIENTATION=-
MTTPQEEITKEELALYDRQIRLWGVNAQKRMGSARILMCSLDGISCEVVKNIVLAGIGSVTLCDSHSVSPFDLSYNYFLREDDVGKNRAEAAAPRVGELNNRVKIKVDKRPIEEISIDDIRAHDVITLGDRVPLSQIIRINNLSHSENKIFLMGGIHGMYGFYFSDPSTYIYCPSPTEDEPNPTPKTTQGFSFEDVMGILSKLRKRSRGDDDFPLAKFRRVDPLFWAFGINYLLRNEGDVLTLPEFQEKAKRLFGELFSTKVTARPLLSLDLLGNVFSQW